MTDMKLFFEVVRNSNYARLVNLLWGQQAKEQRLDLKQLRVLKNQSLSKCKQVTASDVISGWGGGLTLKQARERWSRHGSIIPAHHMDNFTEKNGVTVTYYEHLRWGIRWATRVFAGWSGAFSLKNGLPFFGNGERKDYRGWSCGCPDWHTKHQP